MIETKFKETEIGLMPEDWNALPLSEIMSIKSGGSITADDFNINGKFPVYGGNGVRGAINKYNIDGEYILIGRVGALCGNIHIAVGKNYASEHALICYPKAFFSPWFIAPILEGMNLGQYSGASAQPVLAAKKISSLYIPFPESEEQQKIADALTSVEELISGIKELIEKKRNIKEGAMSELLTGRKRLPEFNEPWVALKLEDLGEFFKGKGIPRAESNSGNIPAIRYGEIYTYHNNYIREFKSFISRDVSDHSFPLINGDICFAGSGETLEDIGKAVAFVDDYEAYAGGDIVVLRPNNNVCSLFMGFLLNTNPVRQQKANKGNGVSIMHISATGLAGIEVTFPSNIEEQQAIADILTSMDSEIEALENKLHKYEQIKQGMMQQLLTGKIRLI